MNSNIEILEEKAERCMEAEKYNEAIIHYETLLEINPEETINYNFYLSHCYCFLNEYDKALENVNRVVTSCNKKQSNQKVIAMSQRAQIYFMTGDYKNAKSDMLEVMRLDSDQGSNNYILLAQIYAGLCDFDNAICAYKKAEQLGITSSYDYYTYSETLLQGKRYDEAERCCLKAIEMDDGDAFLPKCLLEDIRAQKTLIQNSDSKPIMLETHTGHENDAAICKISKSLPYSDVIKELNDLTGLVSVKKEVNTLINFLRINKEREARGIRQVPISKHLVFSGNPGTGKTTVARILAKVYKELGVLSEGQLIEVDRSRLVAGYVGQTAIQTQEIIEKALGGILFIDEAYTLSSQKGNTDYGQEAIDTILKAMEDHREDFVVIVAGYPDLMQEFLDSNPGLRSRFNKFINFEDYNADELTSIFYGMCKKSGYKVADEATDYVHKIFENLYNNRSKNFANGREVRNIFEVAVTNQANRLATDFDFDNEKLMTLTVDDICTLDIKN